MKTTRTRFAPSPTGYLHVGGVRTALFAWLVARQTDGKFILRLEDTDKKREVKGSDEHLVKSLKTLGINYDEGPDIGGPYEPYRQSQRLDHYKKWAQKLIDNGRAYADPYAAAEVQAFREQAQKAKKPFLYRNHRPANPPKWDGGQPLRFKSDPKKYSWHDEVMGDLSTGPEVIDDIIIIKSDGYPTYNFAHIIDGYEMKISHIIRGQEFLASVPNYLNIYEALDIERPIIATVCRVDIFASLANATVSRSKVFRPPIQVIPLAFERSNIGNFNLQGSPFNRGCRRIFHPQSVGPASWIKYLKHSPVTVNNVRCADTAGIGCPRIERTLSRSACGEVQHNQVFFVMFRNVLAGW
jgi:glutamyl/glutaminyl-tRNA synthetase